MTNRRIWDQGEGSGGAQHRPFRGEPRRWAATVLVPVECIRVTLVLHSMPQTDTHCLAFEVDDPHTKELLAVTVDPTWRAAPSLGVAASATLELRAVLLGLFDPDPF